MPQSSPSIPGLPSREMPKPDIGVFRFSRKATETVDGAIKGAYVMGGVDGYAVGQSAGYIAGHVAGFLEGAACSAVAFAIVFFVASVLIKGARR